VTDALSEFGRDSHVEPDGPGAFRAELKPGWVVGDGVNGGFLLATLGRAVGATVPGKPDPIAISAYYLSACTPGPAEIARGCSATAARSPRSRPT